MIEELVSRVFAARNAAHLEHWKTQSYARHKALGSFYDDVIDKIDDLVETYQGYNKLIGDVSIKRIAPNATEWLPTEAKWINDHKNEIANNESMLLNIVDELLAIYSRTHYMLVNLK